MQPALDLKTNIEALQSKFSSAYQIADCMVMASTMVSTLRPLITRHELARKTVEPDFLICLEERFRELEDLLKDPRMASGPQRTRWHRPEDSL